jgi:hypothetical protein
MKLSKICAIYTQSYHRILNECFLKTLPVEVLDLFEYENIDDIGAIPGYPGSPNFKNVNYKKMFYIHEKIKENLGNCIIISDLDIVFFRPFKEMVEQMMDNYDVLLQDNGNGEYNVGFIVINCNPKVLNFWDTQILPNADKILQGFHVGDQGLINEELIKSDIRHNNLPKEFWANRTPYSENGLYNTTIEDLLNKIPENPILFHGIAIDGHEPIKYDVLKRTISKYE